MKNSSPSHITGWLYSYVKTSASLLAFRWSRLIGYNCGRYGPRDFISKIRGRTARYPHRRVSLPLQKIHGISLISSSLSSIVVVHGPNGDPIKTWTHSANNHFWPQDSLPLDVKGARVLNYGYNADVVFVKSTADIWDHAKGLLGSLMDERETDEVSKTQSP